MNSYISMTHIQGWAVAQWSQPLPENRIQNLMFILILFTVLHMHIFKFFKENMISPTLHSLVGRQEWHLLRWLKNKQLSRAESYFSETAYLLGKKNQ